MRLAFSCCLRAVKGSNYVSSSYDAFHMKIYSLNFLKLLSIYHLQTFLNRVNFISQIINNRLFASHQRLFVEDKWVSRCRINIFPLFFCLFAGGNLCVFRFGFAKTTNRRNTKIVEIFIGKHFSYSSFSRSTHASRYQANKRKVFLDTLHHEGSLQA